MVLIPGTYSAQVRAHNWGYAQTGTPYLSVELLVFTEFGEEGFVGKIYFSPKSMGIGRANLRALGFDPDVQNIEEIGDSISLVGNECQIELAEKEFNGKRELQVSRWGTPKPPDKDALRKLGAELKAAKGQKGPAKKAEIAPTAPVSEPPDSDIPF